MVSLTSHPRVQFGKLDKNEVELIGQKNTEILSQLQKVKPDFSQERQYLHTQTNGVDHYSYFRPDQSLVILDNKDQVKIKDFYRVYSFINNGTFYMQKHFLENNFSIDA